MQFTGLFSVACLCHIQRMQVLMQASEHVQPCSFLLLLHGSMFYSAGLCQLHNRIANRVRRQRRQWIVLVYTGLLDTTSCDDDVSSLTWTCTHNYDADIGLWCGAGSRQSWSDSITTIKGLSKGEAGENTQAIPNNVPDSSCSDRCWNKLPNVYADFIRLTRWSPPHEKRCTI